MASFPEVSALDFSLVSAGDSFVQAPIEPLNFEFQYTSDFDYYRPCALDFYFLDAPLNRYAVLRSDLASCFWESLKMKGRFILAAANGGVKETSTDPLASSIPDGKLQEIGMIHPPFPPLHQLTYNFLLLPESPEKIREWIALWQANSHQLAAWIAQAKVQSAKIPSCSWIWPTSPTISYPSSVPLDSPRASPSLETKTENEASLEHDSSLSSDSGALFQESLEPPSKLGTLSFTSLTHWNDFYAPGRVAHAFHAQVESNPLKGVPDAFPAGFLHVTKSEKGAGADNSSISDDSECPSKRDLLPYVIYHGLNYPYDSGRVAHTLCTKTKQDNPKRVRDSSPITPNRDGDEANKRQLVLWRPTIAKVLEMEANLRRGEVSSHSTGLSTNPISSIRVRNPRLGTPNTFPSRRNRKPRLDISLLTADLSDVSDGSSTSSSMDGLF